MHVYIIKYIVIHFIHNMVYVYHNICRPNIYIIYVFIYCIQFNLYRIYIIVIVKVLKSNNIL